MSKFLLAVDAGHGKYVGGNRCLHSLDPNQTAEWVLADRVARAIIERAQIYEGFETIRVDDPTGNEDVGMTQRCATANRAGADFYISLHFDAGIGGGSGGGITAYCIATGGQAEQYRDTIYRSVIQAGGIRGDRSAPLQTANFFVLRETDAPAVLIECGFMDSRHDVPIILNPDYERKIGIAIVDCIAQKNGLKRISRFVDVRPGDYFSDAVAWAVKNGITAGVDESHFAPNAVCTRAQAVTMMWAMRGRPERAGKAFVDVAPTDYFADAVAWASAEGVTAGVDETHFAPHQPCARAQIVTMLWALAGKPEPVDYQPFKDVSPAAYYAKAVQWARSCGISAGVGDNKFAPDDPCTRGQIVAMLYKTKK